MKLNNLFVLQMILVVSFVMFFNLSADKISINNKTDKTVFVSTYYKSSRRATGIGGVFTIRPTESIKLNRLKYKPGYYRRLLFSFNKSELSQSMLRDKYKLLGRLDIKFVKGSKFYIYEKKGVIRGANSVEWNILNKIKSAVSNIKDTSFSPLKKKYMNKCPGANKTFIVRGSTDISNREKKFLKTRKPIVKTSLEKFLGIQLSDDQVPTIAICGSGGGVRAQLSTLGFLLGAEELGLIDCATYIAGVSGSTWAIGPWLASMFSVEGFKNYLVSRLTVDPFKGDIKHQLNPKKGMKILFKKFIFNQPMSLVDIYGGILGKHFFSGFSKHPHNIDLLGQSKKADLGKIPLPIYTSVITKKDPIYRWWEFTPYEFGSDYLGGYIPERASGHSFVDGKTKKVGPVLTLEFILGTCGSAFAVNGQEVFDKVIKNVTVGLFKNVLEKIISQDLGTKRLAPAKVKNFTRGLQYLPRRNEDILTLIDAGLAINIPIPPLLREPRKVDIIMVFDASGDLKRGKASQLNKAKEYADKMGLKFPEIRNEVAAANKKCSVIYDKNDPSVPMIIYLPIIKNLKYSKTFDPIKILKDGGHLSTFNFKYTKEQSKEFIGLTRANIIDSKKIILDAIGRRIGMNRIADDAVGNVMVDVKETPAFADQFIPVIRRDRNRRRRTNLKTRYLKSRRSRYYQDAR